MRKCQFRRQAEIAEDRAMPLRLDDEYGWPLIDVALPGEPTRSYLLDTGYGGHGTIATDPATFERLVHHPESYADPDGQGDRSQHVGLAGTHATHYRALDWAKVAGLNLGSAWVEETTGGSPMIGLGAVRRMKLTLDFPKRRLAAESHWYW